MQLCKFIFNNIDFFNDFIFQGIQVNMDSIVNIMLQRYVCHYVYDFQTNHFLQIHMSMFSSMLCASGMVIVGVMFTNKVYILIKNDAGQTDSAVELNQK